MRKSFVLFGIMLIVSLAGAGVTSLCSDKGKNLEDDTLHIVTSFYPMYIATVNLTEEIEGVTVDNLTENQGGCLHDYQLTTKDMKKLTDADVFVINGGGMEHFLLEILEAYPDIQIVDASEGIELIDVQSEHHHEEDEHEEHEEYNEHGMHEAQDEYEEHDMHEAQDEYEEHEVYDEHSEYEENGIHEENEVHDVHDEHGEEKNAHVWMNPTKYKQQLENIMKGLEKADPKHKVQYEKNLSVYCEKVSKIEKELKDLSSEKLEKGIISFHDAFAYLADALSIPVIKCVEIEKDTSLSAGEVAELIEEARLHNVEYIFTEEQISGSSPTRVAQEVGAKLCVIDSLVSGENDADAYLVGMEKNIELLRKVLSENQ